ncbi:MAG: peptidylprolyl isomerase [Candidatus Cloacimonetes bacterium]|nr:peptidylprolyl isomerase [Candidatus Cloacimonadota bacterium]
MKKLLVLLALLSILVGAGGVVAMEKEIIKVKMVTSEGIIELELFPEKAPITVANFVKYAEDGFYNGLVFHRIMSNFMIQGGGFDIDNNYINPTQKPIKNEANNGLSNEIGTIAMARTNAPHSATSQFFINVKNNQMLNYRDERNWGYCVFGKITKGIEVVNKIKMTPTTADPRSGEKSVPTKKVIINKVIIIKE